ncbi:Neocarzinostatin family protein [Actinopolyspora mzabensis]|uniref:Neocarzinostatin family protein n=1 Tax=Actinopolyspora mzabensis TaxID=995066 RepID=A0A1G8Y7U1_ACTMZ|nr:enediyne antibiotic chromoprotein [Actinopolyspora mzabensis]SDJ98160.1 Neocarzinostatin family protein [Actinopolyspora mzabensis]
MTLKRRTSRLAKAGVVAAATAGLIAGVHSASADTTAPELSVAPSSGLTDGATITATVTGLAANETYWIGPCGMTDNGCAGDPDSVVEATSDGSGDLTTELTVNKEFVGNVGTGNDVSIDCAETQCKVGVYNADIVALDRTPIHFG